jgi:hypothetical protein
LPFNSQDIGTSRWQLRIENYTLSSASESRLFAPVGCHRICERGVIKPWARRNYLIEGVSGTGKTTVCTELRRRGYQAIHGDRELVYRGDPETATDPETGTPTATWMSEHQIWDVEKVKGSNQEEAVTFFCGGRGMFPNSSSYLTAFLSLRSTLTP